MAMGNPLENPSKMKVDEGFVVCGGFSRDFQGFFEYQHLIPEKIPGICWKMWFIQWEHLPTYSNFFVVGFPAVAMFVPVMNSMDAIVRFLPGQWALHGHDPHQLCLFAAGNLDRLDQVGCSRRHHFKVLQAASCNCHVSIFTPEHVLTPIHPSHPI